MGPTENLHLLEMETPPTLVDQNQRGTIAADVFSVMDHLESEERGGQLDSRTSAELSVNLMQAGFQLLKTEGQEASAERVLDEFRATHTRLFTHGRYEDWNVVSPEAQPEATQSSRNALRTAILDATEERLKTANE